ncbi:hypothetical protein [Microbacterium allomyrinae]|uniref:Uncharacterized protein n=1 Tax=Microbacterium allomyrinae TaxID=2830666 RepID=A0A9X1LU07_9MICO|nr:hypothetical protein [Microbacterium allomyrinae]MCC2031831.1 hypothetical protein [Microbacterium allomyrinae]
MAARKPAKRAADFDRSAPHRLDQFGRPHALSAAEAEAIAQPRANLPALPVEAKRPAAPPAIEAAE